MNFRDNFSFLQFLDFNPSLPIFAANFISGMDLGRFKSLLVATFSIFFIGFYNPSFAGEGGGEGKGEKKKNFDAQEVIFGHILDGHEFHFFDITKKDGTKKPIGIPLPVILYSSQRGLDVFMSS